MLSPDLAECVQDIPVHIFEVRAGFVDTRWLHCHVKFERVIENSVSNAD
jgi:hypothetical protein